MGNRQPSIMFLLLTALLFVACGEGGDSTESGDTDFTDATEDSATATENDSASDTTVDSDTGADTGEPPECPEGAIVALTYDDALTTQRVNAVPALDMLQFKATFF